MCNFEAVRDLFVWKTLVTLHEEYLKYNPVFGWRAYVCFYSVLQSIVIYIKLSHDLINIPGGSVVNNLPANAGDPGDVGSISGWGRYSGGGNDYPLQYSCLENSMDRRAWWVTIHGVTKSLTWLSTRAPR